MRTPAQVESLLSAELRPIPTEEAMQALEAAREGIREFQKLHAGEAR
jgi:hypothetical protein